MLIFLPRSSTLRYTMPLIFSKERVCALFEQSSWHPQIKLRLTSGLSSGCHRTHHHRHVRILRASCSFHVPNGDITYGVRDAQRLYTNTH
ncbi:hypothetical protein PoB_007433500 [Plakobranchus ocellatus]|uniref:Uncharacterized protein n=1 Tax=Plakobranchus ocellatus TaxID=259542 RepID=A0AAV4DUI8_9GAST|nr:hypothetical protein PoB_007433500 [Plakobranchus ocellatus]